MSNFYTKFSPLKNVSIRTAHIIQWGAPITSLIIFVFILWFFQGKADFFITVGLTKIHIAYVFIVLIIVQIFHAYIISRHIRRDAYIATYGNIAQGTCTQIRRFPFVYIVVRFNEKEVKRSLFWAESRKFVVGDTVQVRYNPDNDAEYIVYPYDTKNA